MVRQSREHGYTHLHCKLGDDDWQTECAAVILDSLDKAVERSRVDVNGEVVGFVFIRDEREEFLSDQTSPRCPR